MNPPRRFSYHSLGELVEDIRRRGLDLPVSADLSILGTEVRYGRLTVGKNYRSYMMPLFTLDIPVTPPELNDA